jgi:hypothetical protein
MVDWLERHRSALLVGLCAALAALWSPFITIGLLPLVVLGVAHVRFRGLLTVPDLPPELKEQYLGDPGSLFFRHLAGVPDTTMQ